MTYLIEALFFRFGNFITHVHIDVRKQKNIGELLVFLVETYLHVNETLICLQASQMSAIDTGCNYKCWKSILAMNFVKDKLRNSMGDQHFNDCLAIFIEKDFFSDEIEMKIASLAPQGQIQPSTFELPLNIFLYFNRRERKTSSWSKAKLLHIF